MFAKQRKGFEKHKSQKRLFIKIGNISKKQKLSGRLFIKEVKYPKINTDLGMLYWQCLQRALPDWFKEDFSYLLIASDIPDSFLKMQIHYLVPFHPAS